MRFHSRAFLQGTNHWNLYANRSFQNVNRWTSSEKRERHHSHLSLLSVQPPKSFDFSKFEEWPRWVKRFEPYRVISGLSKHEGALQVNTILYAMGGKSEDIFTSFTFDDGADQSNYNRVKEKFDHHFIANKYAIYERAKFNQRVQGRSQGRSWGARDAPFCKPFLTK